MQDLVMQAKIETLEHQNAHRRTESSDLNSMITRLRKENERLRFVKAD